jgi:hypothetical protein
MRLAFVIVTDRVIEMMIENMEHARDIMMISMFY